MDPNSRIDREKAIRELARGRELVDELSRLVQGTFSHDDQSELAAGGYCRGVKKAFEVGISLVKSIDATVPRDQGKRRVSQSKTTVTHSPFADGYQWRKYGQKVIRNVKYPRSYYRCTHASCRAKLLVQQITDSGSLPMYEVTRNNEHTCNAANPPPVSPATLRGSNIITFESDQSVDPSFASGTNEHVHNFFSSMQQMQNLSPRSSDTSSSSIMDFSVPAAQSQQPLSVTDPDVRNNFDSSFPPLSPAGQFYGTDASAYV